MGPHKQEKDGVTAVRGASAPVIMVDEEGSLKQIAQILMAHRIMRVRSFVTAASSVSSAVLTSCVRLWRGSHPREEMMALNSESEARREPNNHQEPRRLRELAAWYRSFAERAGNPVVWEMRLRTAAELEQQADRAEAKGGLIDRDLAHQQIQEQALRGINDGLSRPAAPGL